jgi:hypothetical protein
VRVIGCLRASEGWPRGHVRVVFGQKGCVRMIATEHRQSTIATQCLVEGYSAARLPPFREGTIRMGVLDFARFQSGDGAHDCSGSAP